jgi:SAM-dependent methyltransferase
MNSFETRDSSKPDFWDERFQRRYTPWDKGDVPLALRQFVAAASPASMLIPGCGSAYEVAFLAEHGWDVTAIDFSPAAVAAAQALLGPWAQRVLQADFFSFMPGAPLDCIYERAFLCALPRRMWPAVAARWADLLPAGGQLIGFFYLDPAVDAAHPKGPPFALTRAELDALLEPSFERIADDAVADSIPAFAGKERWQIWRRKPTGSGRAPVP